MSGRRGALGVFALLAGVYLLTTGGHTYAVDEEQMFSAAEALALRGSFALNQPRPGDAPIYSIYGPAQSILALPLYTLGRLFAAVFPEHAYPWVTRALASWFNPFVTAATAALIVLAAARLGYRLRAAAGAGLLYGLATMAWPHSKTFFAEPLTALLLFGAFAAVLPVRFSLQPSAFSPQHRLLLAGFLAGLAPAVKVQAGLGLPLLGFYAAYCVYTGRRTASAYHSFLRPLFVWALGAGLPLALLGVYQWALFGHPLRTGYGEHVWSQFTADFWEGLNGQVWSPGRGLIWYAPPLLLWPVAIGLMGRRRPVEALLCALMLAAHLLFYARWFAWDGAGAWGPRFLNTVLPFAVLPLAALLDWLAGAPRPAQPAAWLLRAALVTTLLLALPVQFAGLAINLNGFLGTARAKADRYRLEDSAIIGHLRLAARQARQWYDLNLAPASVALQSGFSYGETERATPRWTLPESRIALRPPPADHLRLRLTLSRCWAADRGGSVALRYGERLLFNGPACPERTIHLLLPGHPAPLQLDAPPWDPRAAGVERTGPLGVMLLDLAAWADRQPLAVYAEPAPIPPLPQTSPTQRRWTSAFGQWDVWWWLLARSGLPGGPSALLATAWLGIAFGLIAIGVWLAMRKPIADA